MAWHRYSKLEQFEDRHPGLCRQVEAMFKALVPLRTIAAALQAQYGEQINPNSLSTYKQECWDTWGAEI